MKPVELEHDSANGIARIVFNRPEVLNAIDLSAACAFRDCVIRLAEMPGVRCVLLKGNGRAFVTGGDVSRLQMTSMPQGMCWMKSSRPSTRRWKYC